MKLNESRTRKLIFFVKQEPRTIQDIARHLEISWPTAENYVEKISKETGQLSMKVFRGGTRGALKIAYWNYEARAEPDVVREALYRRILAGRIKTDFDPFDIYQHANRRSKKAETEPVNTKRQWIDSFIRDTQDELLGFSGNLSWAQYLPARQALLDILKQGASVHLLARINIETRSNYSLLAPIVKKYPDKIAIRHSEQPLRGWIRDNKIIRLKDVKLKDTFKKGELTNDVRIHYTIHDYQWVNWCRTVFWNIYRDATPAEERVAELESVF